MPHTTPHSSKNQTSHDDEKEQDSFPSVTPTKIEVPVKTDEGLKELIEKNIKWSQVIYNQNKKIKHRLTLLVLGNYIRLGLILIPLILAFVYLPPYIEDLWKQYQPLISTYLDSQDAISSAIETINTTGIDKQQLQTLLQHLGQ